MVVHVLRVGVDVAAILLVAQERVDAAAFGIGAEIEDMEGKIAIADVPCELAAVLATKGNCAILAIGVEERYCLFPLDLD